MARLKDRNKQIPNGLRYFQPETGWKSASWASFDTIVKGLIDHRKGNGYLAGKHKWATDYQSVANEVDAYNARICEAKGFSDYILTEALPFPKAMPRPERSRPVVAAAGNLKRTVAGVGVLKDWLGAGLRPVPKTLAEARGAVCVNCPQNQEGNFWQSLNEIAARKVKTTVEIKNELDLRTTNDGKLKSCQACDCWMELKVHTPLEHILAHTSPEVKAKLDPKCWILAEAK